MFGRDTVWHYTAGIAAYFFGVSFFDFMVYHAAFEILDAATSRPLRSDYVIHSIGDVLSGQIGWAMTKWCSDNVR
jgi:hypothetical protein